MARPVKTLREAAEDMVLASDDGTEYEHNDGCQGEPDCPACWVQGIRRLFDDFPDEGAPVANRERAALALVPVLLASGHDDEEVGSEAAELIDALTTAGVFRDEATVKAEALLELAGELDAKSAEWSTPTPIPEGWDSHHVIVRGATQTALENAAKAARAKAGEAS